MTNQSIINNLKALSGGNGFEVISNTAAHTKTSGFYSKIVVITAATLTTLTPRATAPITGTATGIAYPVGFELAGEFTTITLASGSVIAYNG